MVFFPAKCCAEFGLVAMAWVIVIGTCTAQGITDAHSVPSLRGLWPEIQTEGISHHFCLSNCLANRPALDFPPIGTMLYALVQALPKVCWECIWEVTEQIRKPWWRGKSLHVVLTAWMRIVYNNCLYPCKSYCAELCPNCNKGSNWYWNQRSEIAYFVIWCEHFLFPRNCTSSRGPAWLPLKGTRIFFIRIIKLKY